LAEVERVAVIRTHWALRTISIHGINSWQEAASIRVEEAVSCQLHLGPINVLHSIQFSVEQIFFVVGVLELSEDGDVDEVELLLGVEVLVSELFLLCHAFL